MKPNKHIPAVLGGLLLAGFFICHAAAAYDMAEFDPMAEGDTWLMLSTLTVTGNVAEEGTYGPFVLKTVVTGTKVVNGVEAVEFEENVICIANVNKT